MARPRRAPGNLPPEATSFVGRRRELADVRSKLARGRLTTLVGPGGVGKTRLAIRAGTALERGFRDGARLVELAEVSDPQAVSEAFLGGLDLRAQAAAADAILLAHLRDRELLLVVDNCEHLLTATAGLLARILEVAPGVRVIATSREPLTIAGEHLVVVTPLELPDPDPSEPLGRLAQNEAVALFTERAGAASGSFELTSSNRTAVTELCRRLDGLPLALELAAVRTRVLSPDQILDRLTDRFNLLTGGFRAALPRHQTLRMAIEWSHDLLNEEERALLRRLSAFAGRFDLEDVESIHAPDAPASAPTLDVLSSLVDKSLVVKEEMPGRAVFRLHETMREFAAQKLEEAGEAAVVERRFDDHYTSRCRSSGREGRVRMLKWLPWMEVEVENVRLVLQRSMTRDPRRGLDVAASLTWFWMTRGTAEGVRWLDDLFRAAGPAAAEHAPAHFARGFLGVLQSDPASATPELEKAAAAARRFGMQRLLVESLAMGSIAAGTAGDRSEAARLLAEAEAVCAGCDEPLAAMAVLQARSLNGLFSGDLETVAAASEEGARLGRQTGDVYSLEVMLINLGTTALITGDLAASRARLEEALRIARQIDDRVAQFSLLDTLGWRAALTGRAVVSARLMGAAESVGASAGADRLPFAPRVMTRAREAAIAALGAARFESELAAGRRLSRDEAARLALGESETAPSPASDPDDAAPLGRREAEVAALVAEGLSNKEIGTRLFISQRTVDTHVRSILNKLGFESRAQIAAWVAARSA